MQTMQMFYKRFGIRSLQQLRDAKVIQLDDLQFPFSSTIISTTLDTLEPATFPVSHCDVQFYVHNILELTSTIGSPRVLPFKTSELRKAVKDVDGLLLTTPINDTTTKRPVVVNTSALDSKYHYKHSLTAEVDKFNNYMSTIIDFIFSLNDRRNTIITVPVGDVVPDMQWYRIAMSKPRLWLAQHTTDMWYLLWLELDKYMLGEESMLDPLRGLNITWMFYHKNKATILHNALFDLTLDTQEKDVSHGLVYNISKLTHSVVLKVIPELLQKLVTVDAAVAPIVSVVDRLNGDNIGVVTPPATQLYEQVKDNPVLAATVTQAAETIDPLTDTPIGTPPTIVNSTIKHKTLSTIPVDHQLATISTVDMDTVYVESGMYHTDVSNAIRGVQSAGIIVYKIDHIREENILGDTDVFKVHTRAIDGSSSTLHMTLPAINKDGSYTVDGTDYRLRKQRVEPPIIKTSPSKVVLNSYFGTLFVTRSTRATDDVGRFYNNVIGKLIANDPTVSGVPINVFEHSTPKPTHYDKIAHYYKTLNVGNFKLHFDYATRDQIPGYSKALEVDGVVCGTYFGKPVVMKFDNQIFQKDIVFGTVADILQIPTSKVPEEFVQIKIMGVEIPVGVMLCSRVGLTHILDTGTSYVLSDKRSDPDAILSIKFADTYVHIRRFDHKEYRLIINSLMKMKDLFKVYALEEFDTPDMYQLWVEEQGLAVRYFNEFEILDRMFIDDVSTRELLHKMGEPVEFKALVIRACQMLTTEEHSRPNDGKLLRFRGNERFAGFIYKALATSVRGYKNNTNVNKRKLELAPWEVFNLVTADNAAKPVEDNNPIQFVKERETITLAGMGGRTGQTLTTDNRTFDPNDVGFIGEAATDNGDVGIVTFLSAAPMISDLRGGNASTLTDTKQNPAACHTTSYMLAPGITKDHMPRVSFVNVQNTHNIMMEGIETPYVRTGYEYVFPFKAGKHYAWMAPKDGVVSELTPHMIQVKYTDGTTESGPLGIIAGKSADKVYPHEIVTSLSKGQKFLAEAPISYNSVFFKKDDLYPDKLCYTHSKLIRTAFVDDLLTYEDSCTVSSQMVKHLTTRKLVLRRVMLSFDSDISSVLKQEDKVNPDTPLMIITDNIGSYAGTGTADSLKDLLANVPKANTKGYVSYVECYYTGDVEDMSPSIKALVEHTDTQLQQRRRANGQSSVTGKLTSSHRINGKPMGSNTVEVRFFILSSTGVARGDKFVFGNQLKATVGAVLNGTQYTTNGMQYDATFSYKGNLARIVQSYQDVGAYSLFMYHVGHHLAAKL